jgi:sulfur-oxidizing protein SoxX
MNMSTTGLALLIIAAESVLPSAAVAGDTIASPLAARPGDARRGEALIGDRQKSLCILCHAGPFGERHLQGTLGPDLSGVGGRLATGQIRLRIVDIKQLNPASIMPSYDRIDDEDGRRIAAAWRGRPVLGAGEIEDLVAYLATLKD